MQLYKALKSGHELEKEAKQKRVLTVRRLTVPISSRIVNTSKRAWVGCSPTPSPALITGLRQSSAASCNCKERLKPQEKCKTLGRFALSPISRAASSRVFYQLVSSPPTFSTKLFKILSSFLDHAHLQGNVGTKVCKTYLNCSGLRVTNNHHITVRGHYLHRICEKTTKNITRSLLP